MIDSSAFGAESPPPAVAPRELRLRVVPLPGGPELVVLVAGEADLSTYELLRDQLVSVSAGGPTAVIVDVSGLSFCDLSGLDALLEAACISSGAGVPMTFQGMSPRLSWLFATFPHRHTTASRASALASCAVRQARYAGHSSQTVRRNTPSHFPAGGSASDGQA